MQHFPHPGDANIDLIKICRLSSEIFKFKSIENDEDDGRTDGRRTIGILQGVPKNVHLFLENVDFLTFSEYVSETFTHSLHLDTFNGDVYLSLSFVVYAELLPLILKLIFSSCFSIFNICLIITWCKKFCDSNYVALNFPNRLYTKMDD